MVEKLEKEEQVKMAGRIPSPRK
jgi:uncharacterized iron-regulated protein